MDTFSIVILMGAGQGALLALALLTVRMGDRHANRILAALILSMSYVITILVLYHTRAIYHIPHLVGTQTPFVFVFGPLIYLYVKALCGRLPASRWRFEFLHFIPFVAYVIYLWPIYMLPAEYKTEYVLGAFFDDSTGFQRTQLMHMTATLAHGAIYLGLAMRMLLRRKDLIGLRYLLAAFIGVWAVTGIRLVYDTFMHSSASGTLLVIPSALAVVVYAIGYAGLRHSALFTGPAIENAESTTTENQEKYENSTLTRAEAEQEKAALLELMDEERPYLNADLSLHDLAVRRDLSTHHLSQILNEHVERSFFEFVNGYRVEEAMRRLRDPRMDHFTVTSIAHDVGFNSRSAFYEAFKKHAGCTPTAYKKLSRVD